MDKIKQLILRSLRDELSEDDQRQLQEWLAQSGENEQLLEDLSNPALVTEALEKMGSMHKSKVWNTLQSLPPETMGEDRIAPELPLSKPVRRFSILPWMTAAVVIALLGIGAWWWSRTHPSPITPAAPVIAIKQDVLPGGNKAILSLSNGKQLLLDSAMQDTILTEGSAIIAGAGGRLAYNAGSHPAATVTYNTLTTPRGGEYQLTLPDGTKVWLNAASSITYPTAFTGTERKVTITGEAYLEVAQKASQPFKVIVNDITLDVLGTSFNVNAYADEPMTNTTLVEGKLKVSGKAQEVILAPGQQAQVIEGTDRIELVRNADVEQALAWKNGRFAFKDADLFMVMRQLARWYNVEITYEGKIPKREFNGKIDKSLTLSAVLEGLAHARVHYNIEDGNRLIIRP